MVQLWDFFIQPEKNWTTTKGKFGSSLFYNHNLAFRATYIDLNYNLNVTQRAAPFEVEISLLILRDD